MASKSNILFIFTDQLRGDSIGTFEGSQVISPNIDRLAKEGTNFTRCISNAPLCVPARTCLMTGQLVRENGIWSNRSGADPNGPSHVRNIRDSGYQTAVIGKTHLWRDGPGGEPGKHVKEMTHNLAAWGFDYSHEINDPIETAWMGCYYTDYLGQHGWLEEHRKYIMDWFDEMRTGNMTPWGQEPAPVPDEEDIDSYIGRRSVEWLQSVSLDRPFYLQVQFTGPHDPFDGPHPYREMYDVTSLDPGLTTRHEAPTPMIRERRRRAASVLRSTEYQRQRWRAWYYANITLIDEWIGRIRATLEARNCLDNTWVILNSDHGEMLGDHGLSSKAVFYREAMHVPCVIRPPKDGQGESCNDLVEHVDLPVTMVDIAGAEPLDGSLGQSLVGRVVENGESENDVQPKQAVISELFGQTSVVTEDFSLTVTIEDNAPDQLFDLKEDPQELVNLVSDPEYSKVIADLIEEHIAPLSDRTNQALLTDYRDYVQRTGRLN